MSPCCLTVDVGSTYTKAALVDLDAGTVLASGQIPTTSSTDVLHGLDALADSLGATPQIPVLACSSAGGGLRLAVLGYERSVTAEAGRRVGLSAGARVVHVGAGRLDATGVADLRQTRPDIVLLVGGTDGGNADILLANAAVLAGSRLRRGIPFVVAGNAEATPAAAERLRAAGRLVRTADNVLPQIGVVEPASARAAIRDAFVRHVIGGKGLSRGPRFARLVRAATPDAVLAGVAALADAAGSGVLVVDVGGATTDVYSALAPAGEDAEGRREVVAELPVARTVEADLGVRWSADGVLDAAAREGLAVSAGLPRYAAHVATDPAHLPTDEIERTLDLELARLAALVAVRRHARPAQPGESGRDLRDVTLALGSGGVLRHGPRRDAEAVLRAVASDDAGGGRTPRAAQTRLDAAYLLVVVGLLAETHPDAARRLAPRLLD